MLQGWIIRWFVIGAFFIGASMSASYDGLPWWFDGWVSLPYRELPILFKIPFVFLAITLLAELFGALLPARSLPLRRKRLAMLVVVAICIPLLWTFRVRGWLGDLNNIDKAAVPSQMVETAEPLGASTHYFAMWTAERVGIKYSTSLQIMSVVFGAGAIGAIFLWAELISAQWMLVFLMLVSTGATVLFCGYPEKGTPKSIPLVCWYVYAGTRALRGQRGWDHISSLFLSLATLMHGSVASLLPAHALSIWLAAGWRRGAVGVAVYLAPMLLMLAAVFTNVLTFGGHPAGNLYAPTFWLKEYCITNCGYDFFSRHHFTDILNCHLILAPFTLLCLPEALWRARGAVERWLLLGTLGCVFLSIVWFPTFGMRSDWDIFVITPLLMSYFTVQVAARHMEAHRFSRLATAWIAASALHSLSWWLFFTPGIG